MMKGLSHHECHVLALVQKWQPTTAYFVRKALVQRLASDASDSPGSVYPAIERLKRAGKPFKVINTACMRKLLVILNTLVKNNSHWNPSLVH